MLRFYDELLEEDSSNSVITRSFVHSDSILTLYQAIWRRRAHVLRQTGKLDRAVDELSAMLDTFYTEVDGWLELADIYLSCQQ